eukprot:TRINITY_DN75598_c0_g1_i1.p1 TRINITY_DN75598_c0_g1~~TRINITY_DN75598_c0_g1_i1.p1  ORF type:complete len:576 (-),score=78.16 TRINITY_DN75598_c0_g1_i1:109-1836(-)
MRFIEAARPSSWPAPPNREDGERIRWYYRPARARAATSEGLREEEASLVAERAANWPQDTTPAIHDEQLPPGVRTHLLERGSRMPSWSRSHAVPTAWVFACTLTVVVRCLQAIFGLPLQYLLKDAYGASPATVAFVSAPCALIWAACPLWGILADAIPLCGSHRRSYAVAAAAITTLAFLSVAHIVTTTSQVACCIYAANLGIAFLNIVSQAIVVDAAKGSRSLQGALASMMSYFVMRQTGMAAGVLLYGAAMNRGSHPHTIFARAAIAPALALVAALYLPDLQSNHQSAGHAAQTSVAAEQSGRPVAIKRTTSLREELLVLSDFLCRIDVCGPALFVCICAATPRTGNAMFFFYTEVLFFRPHSVAALAAASHVWALIGFAAYGCFCQIRQVLPLRAIFQGVWITATMLTCLQVIMLVRANLGWGFADAFFILFDDGMTAAALEVMLLPVMAVTARACPPHLESTVCATIFAAYNTALFCSVQLGGTLCSRVFGVSGGFGLEKLGFARLVMSMLQLAPLFWLSLVPEEVCVGISPRPHGTGCEPREQNDDTVDASFIVSGRGSRGRAATDTGTF